MEEYKQKLLEKRAQLLNNVKRLEDESSGRDRLSREVAMKDSEGGDAALEAMERSQSAAMIGNLRDMLTGVDEALRNIEEGTYGVCDWCGKDIPKKRLNALPEATMCTQCRSQRGAMCAMVGALTTP